MAPPLCLAAPAHALISLSPTTSFSFDPMDLDSAAAAPTTTMPPHGIKRKLNLLYQSMGESPRKRTKTRVVTTRAYNRHEFRVIQDWHYSTPEYALWASDACKKMALKSLFFRYKPNSTCFDFALDSNTQGTVSAARSRAHDASMHLFKGNGTNSFAAEYLAFAHQLSLASSSAPSSAPTVVPPPATILASVPAPTVAPAIVAAPIVLPEPAPVSAPAQTDTPSVANMDDDKLDLSHPSRLGKSMLVKKEGWRLGCSSMSRSINDLDKDARWMKAEGERLKAGISESKKTKSKPTHGQDRFSEEQQQQILSTVTPPVGTSCPFIEESDDEDEEKGDSMEDESSTSTTPPGSPLRLSDQDRSSNDSASSQDSLVRAPIVVPILTCAPTAVVLSETASITASAQVVTTAATNQGKTDDAVDKLPLSRLEINKDRSKTPRSRQQANNKMEKPTGISKQTAQKSSKKADAKRASTIERALLPTMADKFIIRVETAESAIEGPAIEEEKPSTHFEDSSPWADEPCLQVFDDEN